MRTSVTLIDRYNSNLTCNLIVNAVRLDDPYDYENTYYALLTAGQVKKVKRYLPNGCRNLNETRQGRDGRIVEAEIYFNAG